jgi:dienelactone hydrolase
VFDAPDADERLDAAAALVPDLDDRGSVRDAFVGLLRGLLPPPSTQDDDDLPDQLRRLPGREVLQRLFAPVLPVAPTAAGATALHGTATHGAAAGLGLTFGGFKAAAQRVLNLLTYYQMKERAGVIGTAAAAALGAMRQQRAGVGIHLVGHSFGGRLVTAAAAARPPLLPDSLTLLQAAYSHYGLAQDYDGGRDGFFRAVVVDKLVRGPVLVTHSDRDLAVGLAYPLASRLAGQDASAMGDANDRFGGIGRNGARKTPEAVDATLLASGQPYRFADAVIHNLNADHVIIGHSDIVRPETAYAVLTAVVGRVTAPV